MRTRRSKRQARRADSVGFSRAQQGMFRSLVERAWNAHCAREQVQSDNHAMRDFWYRQNLYAACGVTSTTACNNTTDLDYLLIRFAVLANDEQMMTHATAGAERRMRHQIVKTLAALGRIEGRYCGWSYAQAIYATMNRYHHLPDAMADCPAELLRNILCALDTHLRRLTARRRSQAQPAHNDL